MIGAVTKGAEDSELSPTEPFTSGSESEQQQEVTDPLHIIIIHHLHQELSVLAYC